MTENDRPDEDAPAQPPREKSKDDASTAASTSTDATRGPEELPYIDDPVSRWWIAAIVAVFVLILAYAIFFGAGGVFEGVLDSEDPTATPAATMMPSPSPEPTAEPTPEPTAEPTPEPTAEQTPEPTAEPTPEPTAEPTPEPASTDSP